MGDFDRDVVCLAGLPFDALDMAGAVGRLTRSVAERTPLFLSTPNLNFVIGAQRDESFRNSVIHSELSVADGMPLVWIARLLGLPIRERVAGSCLFEALRDGAVAEQIGRPVSVFFFGGPPGVAEKASAVINASGLHMVCAGFHCPGFGGVDAMSSPEVIAEINASGADFLVVALGAVKGQAWIERNRASITVPVISHLGAVVNFVAGTVNRAPVLWQRLGLEWLWRIKEEPALYRRYLFDALGFGRLLMMRVVPYAFWHRLSGNRARVPGQVSVTQANDVSRIALAGDMDGEVVDTLRAAMHEAVLRKTRVEIDLSACGHLGFEFFGLLLLLKKELDALGLAFALSGLSKAHRRLMFWNGLDYLPGC